MGISRQTVEFLTAAKQHGVSFERTLTLGVQELFGYGHPKPAQGFLVDTLGATTLDALDNSDFEGANVLHDLNEPLPEELRGKYTAVFDGGTLEHVYNAPKALANVLELVAEGGHYIAASPGNNQMGHGFFQFSPEFYFRGLSPEAGFQVETLVAVERGMWTTRWFAALDPGPDGTRHQVQNRRPVELMVVARRVGAAASASSAPQQSDYAALWADDGSSKPTLKQRLYRAAPDRFIVAADPLLRYKSTSWRNGGFRRIRPEEAFEPAARAAG